MLHEDLISAYIADAGTVGNAFRNMNAKEIIMKTPPWYRTPYWVDVVIAFGMGMIVGIFLGTYG